MKLSFLIAAHNEEKIIRKTLENLLNLPYKDYEVILGLDGCTDRTEEIVKEFTKKSKKFKYFKLNLRSGKPAVINNIVKMSKGDIIIINDADWVFKVGDSLSLHKFLSVFEDSEVGGIAESFPVEWNKDSMEKGNWVFKMVSYSSLYWFKFQKDNFTKQHSEMRVLTEPTMFLTNIFRKELYSENFSLGDDFERTKHIFDKGFKIAIFDDPKMPRMVVSYNKIVPRDFFKQKIRTSIARKQLSSAGLTKKKSYAEYYSKSLPYIFFNSFKSGIYAGILVFTWIFLTALAEGFAIFQPRNTKKGWTLRLRR